MESASAVRTLSLKRDEMIKAHLTIVALFLSALLGDAYAQFSISLDLAQKFGCMARITVQVVDEEQQPVPDAEVQITFLMNHNKDTTIVKGKTQADGLFSGEGRTMRLVYAYAKKEGYYKTRRECHFERSDPPPIKNGKWQPWDPVVTLILREKKNPIPLYATMVEQVLPKGVPVGFDCTKAEFMPPVGKGEVADFTVSVSQDGTFVPRKGWLEIKGVNEGDGFLFLDKTTYSTFHSLHEAPEDGYSNRVWVFEEYPPPEENNQNVDPFEGDKKYMIFRSRTKRDAEGRIVEACYGKIYDSIYYSRGTGKLFGEEGKVKFKYYFNPTPNDRNIEYKVGYESNLFWINGKGRWNPQVP